MCERPIVGIAPPIVKTSMDLINLVVYLCVHKRKAQLHAIYAVGLVVLAGYFMLIIDSLGVRLGLA